MMSTLEKVLSKLDVQKLHPEKLNAHGNIVCMCETVRWTQIIMNTIFKFMTVRVHLKILWDTEQLENASC